MTMEKAYYELAELIDNLTNEVESLEYDEEIIEAKYYEIEAKLEDFDANNYDEMDLSDLKKKMKANKEALDLYDQEGTLDMMFPDRHEDDFDEDSMSGESF